MRSLSINRQWLAAHESLIQVSFTFVQLQKVVLSVIWHNEHSRYLARNSNGSLCGGAALNSSPNDNRFEYAGLVPLSYIFLSTFGIIAVIVKSTLLVGCFLALDLVFGVLIYSVNFMDTVFVPLFTSLSAILIAAYLLVLTQSNHDKPIVTYGTSKTIRSPDSTTITERSSQ